MRGALMVFLVLSCILLLITYSFLERQRTELKGEMSDLHRELKAQEQKLAESRQMLQEAIRLQLEQEGEKSR